MTKLPRPFCPECRQPLGATGEQVSVYGLTGEHYACAKRRIAMHRDVRPYMKDADWKPKPDKLEGPNANGWLAPDGEFYGCTPYIHIALGSAMAEYFYSESDSSDLEERGWGHISNAGFHQRGSWENREMKPTQAQVDALWDWFRTLKEGDKPYTTLKWFFERMKE